MAKKKEQPKKEGKLSAPKRSELETLLSKMKPAHVRFTYLYMGGEDGKCWNNATLAYLVAYEIQTDTRKQSDGKYTSEYLSAKTSGYELLTNPDIQRLRHLLLLESGFSVDTIKKRYSELAYQNKYPAIAVTATDRIAKITNVIKDDSLKINVPEIERLTETMQKLLTPKK